MRRITLPQDTRTFRRTSPTGSLLARIGLSVPAGRTLVVSEPVTMVYDHRDQSAVWFKEGGEEYFLIVAETGVPELMASVAN